MRHRAPRTLDFLKAFTFPRSSRYLLAGRRRAGWLVANQKTRLTLAMASVMVLACAAVVAATEIPGDDDTVAATDAPSSAAQALRSGTTEQVSRSSGRAPWDMSGDAPTQAAPDQQAPAPEGPQPGSDGTGVPSPDPEDESATPEAPAPVPSPELPSQTPTTDGGGLGVSSPPSLGLPTSTPTESYADPEEPTGEESKDESSDDWEDSSGSDSGEEWSEDESSTATPADATAPETEIVSSPTVTDSAVSASSFEFTANESATFMCSLDGQAYAPCGSPAEYGELSPGWHTFAVQATDATGNVDPSPAQVSWLTTGADSAPLVDEVTPSEDSLLP
jgi:large repetitive protein